MRLAADEVANGYKHKMHCTSQAPVTSLIAIMSQAAVPPPSKKKRRNNHFQDREKWIRDFRGIGKSHKGTVT